MAVVVGADGHHDGDAPEVRPSCASGISRRRRRRGRRDRAGRFRHPSTDANALSLRFETVATETLDPQKISETPSILLVETPARRISIIAASTEDSRLR